MWTGTAMKRGIKCRLDETITSYCDKLISLFEMINEKNGGKKTIVNNVEVYQISKEQPKPVIFLTSIAEQTKQLKKEQEKTLTNNILTGTREEKARAAYISVCLDLNDSFSKKYPDQWKAACYQLSGYWRLMNNVLNGQYDDHFEGLTKLKEKFFAAGFKAPLKKYSDDDLYSDFVIWKEPNELY